MANDLAAYKAFTAGCSRDAHRLYSVSGYTWGRLGNPHNAMNAMEMVRHIEASWREGV